MPYLKEHADGSLSLTILVQAKASRTAICGIHDGHLKIAVTAAPTDGKANKAVLAFLAKTLAVARRDLQLVSGKSGRRKNFRIRGLTQDELRQRLGNA